MTKDYCMKSANLYNENILQKEREAGTYALASLVRSRLANNEVKRRRLELPRHN